MVKIADEAKKVCITQKEKVAIAKHCNLKPPDLVPLVLGFNYEARNALAYNTTIPQSPQTRFQAAQISFLPRCIECRAV